MPSTIKRKTERGIELVDVDIFEILPPQEGEINQYYGRIGSGKTYAATSDILEDLQAGRIVYANWKVKWDGYDERDNKFLVFLGILGIKKYFYSYPRENFHFLPLDGNILDTLERLTDCKVYLDEGHLVFDSYVLTKMSLKSRASVLHTRHYDRVINIISQRPTAIHATLRGNVNRFYKCVQSDSWLWKLLRLRRFYRIEIQDLKPGTEVPDDDNEEAIISVKSYWGKKEIYGAYDTKYMRGDTPRSQMNYAHVYMLSWRDRIRQFFSA